MGFKIVEILINDAREKILVQDYMPLYYPNLFITTDYRGRSPNTQDKVLRHIALFCMYLENQSIDLVNRLEQRPNSVYLTDFEISRFIADANFSKSTLDKKYSGVRILEKGFEYVSRSHTEQRCEAVRDYLEFLYEKLGDDKSRAAAAIDLKKRINRKIKSASPAWKKRRNNDLIGLSDLCRHRLLEATFPEFPDNPFTADSLKYRNYIIILLGLELGLRRSEMLLIKISDLMWHNNQIAIVGLEDETIDPRKFGPRLKTNERVLPLTDNLAWAIRTYIDDYRSKKNTKSNSKKHPFLLVAHHRNEGQPMSIKAVDGLFNRLGEVFPELAGIHPHALRHDAVFSLLQSMKVELDRLTPEDRTTQTQKVLTYAFGWGPDSDMPSLYGAKYWKEEADKAILKRSDRFKKIREQVELSLKKGTTSAK